MVQQVLKAKYVLDTSFFVLMRTYYPDIFPSIWERLDELAVNEVITSIDEVKSEIRRFGGEQSGLLAWVERNKYLFAVPSAAVQEKMREIMKITPKALPEKKIEEGAPWADAFVIAKALDLSATVVTREIYDKPEGRRKPSLIKIPNICEHFDVPCISPQEFMKVQQWCF